MKLQYYIVLWQHTLQKYRNGCCQECKYNETQYSKLTVKASKVSLSLPNVQTIDATVWRLRFGWTLWPASLMDRSWLTTWSMTLALISLEHLTRMPRPWQGPLYLYHDLFLVLVLVFAEVVGGGLLETCLVSTSIYWPLLEVENYLISCAQRVHTGADDI